MHLRMKTAFVTGGTSGIGLATAPEPIYPARASHGCHLRRLLQGVRYPSSVRITPFAERNQRLDERFPERRQRVVDHRRHLVVIVAYKNVHCDQLP